MDNSTHFLLTPDKAMARYVRRELAHQKGHLGVVVGSWIELVELARKAYLIPDALDNWDKRFPQCTESIAEAFWTESLQVAPEDTLSSLKHSLALLLGSTAPEKPFPVAAQDILPQRGARYIQQLAQLNDSLEGALPADLAAIKALLTAESGQAIRPMHVYHIHGRPRLSLWQKALLDKLAGDAGSGRNEDFQQKLASCFAAFGSATGGTSALSFLQTNLFAPGTKRTDLDSSLQWLGVRDALEEVEILAGMIQQALKGDPTLSPADIAILAPRNSSYNSCLQEVFSSAGLALAGLEMEKQQRDLGREAVLYFLMSQRRPAPAIALCALLSNPLMPWTHETGNALAQKIMAGNYALDAPHGCSAEAKEVLGLIRNNGDSPTDIQQGLIKFIALLSAEQEDYLVHLNRAQETAGQGGNLLAGAHSVPWQTLLQLAAPAALTKTQEIQLVREGIGLFYEHNEPWRLVRHLFVLGFADKHYPSEVSRSPVLSDTDIGLLKKSGLDLETEAEIIGRRRQLFKRQLQAASDSITFMSPRRDLSGGTLLPSQSLTFMAQLFAGVADPEELIMDLDRASDRQKIIGLQMAQPTSAVPPKAWDINDISLQRNLFELRTDKNGDLRPESPSSLEKLMISPFAWFLDRSGNTPQEWAPESLDPAAKGTLVHALFEKLFQPDKPLPSATQIRQELPNLFNNAVSQLKPFLLRPEWHVERRHLLREAELAALDWQEILQKLGVKIIAVEAQLGGELDNLPLHGFADMLMTLDQDRLYVVDYKKSTSRKRREQMKKGYDCQASLYRLMLQSGGIAAAEKVDNKTVLNKPAQKQIGALYYMMNDQVALADTDNWTGKALYNVEELGDGISSNAMARIRERIAEIKSGRLEMNTEGDEEWYEKHAGISAHYKLDVSPLVKLFMHPAEEEVEI